MRTIIVWIPMLDGDEHDSALEAADIFSDRDVAQFWDPDKRFGYEVRTMLGGTEGPPAWDIYLVYDPGATTPRDVVAQAGGVILSLRGKLPPKGDQSRLPAWAKGHAIVVGEQSEIDDVLAKIAR